MGLTRKVIFFCVLLLFKMLVFAYVLTEEKVWKMPDFLKNAKKPKKRNSTEFCSARRRKIGLLVGIFGKHSDGIYIYIYRCDVMNPFVRGGGGPGGPAAAHAQRGARQWAKQWSNSPLPELPPSALAGDRATRRQAEKGPVQACGPELPPSRPKTGGVQATSRRRTLNQAAAKASNGTVMHAPTSTPRQCRGRPSSKSVHDCPRSSTKRGGGARCE